MVAGVCSGIADHFGIDPILVRIGFVVASVFGGAGVVAYVAAWIFIPEEDEATSIGERVVREHKWARIAGFVLIAIAISSLASPLWWFGGHAFFAVLLILGGLFLLSPSFAGPSPDHPPRAEAVDVRQFTGPEPDRSTGPAATTTPLLLDAPPPPPAPPAHSPHRRRRGGLGAITMGVLLVGAGIVGLVIGSGHSVEPTYVFATGLLLVGIALVLSTWLGRSLVLIPIGLVLVALMSVSTVIEVPLTGGVGQRNITPLSLSDLHREYHLGMGEMRLDLTHLPLERGANAQVTATVGVGHLLLTIPRDAVVQIHGHAGLGAVRFLDDTDGGVRVDRDTTLSAPGESAPHLTIDVEVGIGQVEVRDAAS